MGLDLWFREDVVRILRAVASAGDRYGPEYLKAVQDVALAFGVEPPGYASGTARTVDLGAYTPVYRRLADGATGRDCV